MKIYIFGSSKSTNKKGCLEYQWNKFTTSCLEIQWRSTIVSTLSKSYNDKLENQSKLTRIASLVSVIPRIWIFWGQICPQSIARILIIKEVLLSMHRMLWFFYIMYSIHLRSIYFCYYNRICDILVSVSFCSVSFYNFLDVAINSYIHR